jgi:NADH-quinone oxidoreductase subunit E
MAELNDKNFSFTKENLKIAEFEIKKYPEGRGGSAIISLLWIAQKQNEGWLSPEVIDYIAKYLGTPQIRVMEIATFYSMFNLNPVGKYHFQMCGTTPCMLSGSNELKKILQNEIGEQNTVSNDQLFSWVEVECLGACCNAPVVQINDDYYEDLESKDLINILKDLRNNKTPKIGSYKKRISSEPVDNNIQTQTDKEIEDIVKRRNKPGLSV